MAYLEENIDDWSTVTYITSEKAKDKSSAPNTANYNNDGPLKMKEAVLIPQELTDLKLHLITSAHGGMSVHRLSYYNCNALCERFTLSDLRDDVRTFLSACLLCVLLKSGNNIPLPLATTLQEKYPNEIIHFE